MRDSFHAATVRINRLWDQASASLAPSGPSQETRPAPSTALRITMSGVVVEPGGSLEMLSRATIANPPAMLKRPGGDFYVGFGSLETLKGCRFLPMSTNRCISQDVVAQRVSENLARLREEGEYYDFGQISLVAVATPSSEQYVEEQPAAMSSTALVTDGGCSEGGRNRFARFYVLDGQHRLSTMIELARERPNVPIWFDLSIRVAPDKESANAALLHMQQTYRADPKCFFAADGEPYVSKRPPSLPPSTTARPHILCPPGCCPVCLRRGGRDCRAHTRSRRLAWPGAFDAASASLSSFARPVRQPFDLSLTTGSFSMCCATHLLAEIKQWASNRSALHPAGRPAVLFDALKESMMRSGWTG